MFLYNISSRFLLTNISASHDVLLPCWEVLPEFLSKTNYQIPQDPVHTPFREAFKTQMPAFEWARKTPKIFNDFNFRMPSFRESKKIFLDFYPFEEKHCKGVRPEDILFVDVGGDLGQDCAAFKHRLSHVPGRVINQDQAAVIKKAWKYDGVEHENHDFMKDQPLQGNMSLSLPWFCGLVSQSDQTTGARAYYLRNILHNYPDEKCLSILQHVIMAMNQDSVSLIDEIVIPNEGAQWRQTQLDLAMMASLAGMKRTEGQWRHLLTRAGLNITGIFLYGSEFGDSIIEAVPIQW